MRTQRMAYWWLRFVISGRFWSKFLNVRRSETQKNNAAEPVDCEPPTTCQLTIAGHTFGREISQPPVTSLRQ
jgi:hypothetical protein